MAIKRSKFQRKAGIAPSRVPTLHAKGKIAPKGPIDPSQPPPTPQESAAMAADGVHLNRGSSNQDQLSPEGIEQVRETGDKLAAKGGLDQIITSPSVRTQQTAQEVAAADPEPPPVSTDQGLESWAQGNLEGQPEIAVKQQIRDLIRKNPRAVIPGQGALTTRPGESFDQYRLRALPAIRGVMQELANNPTSKIGVPLHSSVIKLTKGWLANGAPDDFSIKPDQMDKEAEAPGTVARMFPDEDGNWSVNNVNLDDSKLLPPGIFLIRHGSTPWNAPQQQEKGSAAQDSLALIAKHMNKLDPGNLGRIRGVAQKAVDAGHLSDQEVSDAIDNNLPSPEDAADLPNHQLLAVTALASPAKKAAYAPLIQRNFGDPSSLPAPLAKHLKDILPPPDNAGALPA